MRCLKNEQFIALMYGWVVILGLILFSSVLLAGILHFTSLNDPNLSWATLAIGFIALFIGGFVAGMKGRKKGWVIGSLTGLGFTLFTFIVQYLEYNQTFTMSQMFHHAGFIVAATIGGVIAVNLIVNE